MPTTFIVNPVDQDCERFLYPHERKMPCRFEFEPGITVLVGANGAGKTTLMKRLHKALQDEGTPVTSLRKDNVDKIIESQYALANNVDAMISHLQNSRLSEGQAVKNSFSFLIATIRAAMHMDAETDERWAIIDGMDSSQSIDQLKEMAEFLDLIEEDAPENIKPYIIVTTNNFEIAKNRRCLCVNENKTIFPKTYRDFSAAVMRSARWLQKSREVSDREWDDAYSSMKDYLERS